MNIFIEESADTSTWKLEIHDYISCWKKVQKHAKHIKNYLQQIKQTSATSKTKGVLDWKRSHQSPPKSSPLPSQGSPQASIASIKASGTPGASSPSSRSNKQQWPKPSAKSDHELAWSAYLQQAKDTKKTVEANTSEPPQWFFVVTRVERLFTGHCVP